ncbi:SDR family oxidoreductase [Nocardioides sp. zg-579]|uniref:SDR family oxidoreductase n=2 Tax=Nocardioides marmotae TaxID=2663857 RepID=A0A6I3J3V5_9ACTN|nr:SDR family oxidoreductase [Nocardioides marmotae]MCR6030111.1 SDR family oxidoreductase [Gordonia jinghuaiqii]MTB93742.1 SDR family oxidoreductase [Nocardioides marmotae]QKE03304.1 SDR family oxidoreductase [Nocardioides marmotae]
MSVALVTGGTGAIGSAVVRSLVSRGSHVAFTWRSDAAKAAALEAELGGQATGVRLDLTDPAAAVSAVAHVVEAHGGLDTLVYASGPFVPFKYVSQTSAREFADFLARDAGAFFNVLEPALPHIREAKGSIVAVATTALSRVIVRDGLSAAPKGAIEGILRTLAVEEGRFGVRANLVGVGMTSVGMATELLESGAFTEQQAVSGIPLRRFATAEDVAEAVAFLASAKAGFISGQTLNVDGGYSA